MMSKLIPIASGDRFGRLVAIERVATDPHQRWRFACDCGNEVVIPVYCVRRRQSQSCGCFQRDLLRKHGMAGSPEHKIWRGMINRCTNPKNSSFKNYGGRGITVCEEWRTDFGRFFSDMGSRPSVRYTLERIDNDKGYRFENCRWATRSEQRRNQRPRKKRSK